ncbi:kinase-like domain-containing protein [Haematococcus lacustris]
MLTGGELLEEVLSRGSFTEQEARCCFVQLLRGIQYLHSRGVVHRDLKLENVLLASAGDIRHIKIADFGLAKRIAPDAGLQTYVAPEVIMGLKGHQYGPGVDMWSAGVVLFILLGGYPPFWSESEPVMFEQIRKGAFTFNDPVWAFVTQEAKDLICSLLVTDPEHRLTATQALAHPWVSNLPLSGRPPRQPPLPAPTPSASLPFSLRGDHAEGQERKPATPPSSQPRVQGGVRGGGRARQQQVQTPEGGRQAALAFIRSLELPAVKLPGPSSPPPPPAAAAAAAVTATPPPMSTQEPGPAASCTPAGLGGKAGASARDGVSDSVTQAESIQSPPQAGGSKGAGAAAAERVGDRGVAGAGGWTGMAQGFGSGKAEGKAKSVAAATAAPNHALPAAVPPPVPPTLPPPLPPQSAFAPQLLPAPPAPAVLSPPPACRACDGGPTNPAAVPIPLTSHAISLGSSLSPGGGSWELGAGPDSAYCRLPSVTVAAQQQGTLCGAARTCAVQDALASVEGMLARCSSGAASELTQEDVLLLLHTKVGRASSSKCSGSSSRAPALPLIH